MSRKISLPSREAIISMLAQPHARTLPDCVVTELRSKGLIRRESTGIDVQPHGARKIERYQLTPRGVQIAEQLTANRIGFDLCWRT